MARPRALAVLAAAVLLSTVAGLPAARAADAEVVCRFSADFTEVSGLAASTQHPGVLWLHEDSGSGPWIHAIDARTCATLADVRIDGARARDVEAIGMGAMPDGSPAIWLADIGDNNDAWPYVEVLRIREPRELRDRAVRARTFRVAYADRPHNAEALLVNGGQLWIVTKQLARGALYRLPARLDPDAVNTAVRVRAETGLVTDGAIAPDGSRYVLRDYFDARLFTGLPPGTPGAAVDLPAQRQGEAITFSDDGRSLYLASERDRRLLRVPLDGTAAASAPASLTSAAPSSSTVSLPTPSEPQAVVPSGDAVPWWAVGIGALVIVAVFALAERRRRA